MRIRLAFIIPLLVLSAEVPGRMQAQVLDTTTFVVMGDGLAAGMGNFGLSSVLQNQSFPARVAAAMGTGFNQPLIQPPGIGDVIGYPAQEVDMQKYPQGSVRQFYYPTDLTKAPIQTPPIFVLNTSVPGLTLADAVSMRPVPPIVQKNVKQTVFNMILGFPQLIFNQDVPLLTQFEYAKNLFPTVALVELGYYEALNAAVVGDPSLMPDPASFGTNYATVLNGLRGLQAQVIATTIPNPIDTAYFNSLPAAASVLQTVSLVFTAGYPLNQTDLITRNGLLAIATDFTNKSIGLLPRGSTLSAANAADITNRVNALNAQIISAAKSSGAVVYDLNAFLHKVKTTGVAAGSGTVNGDYMGGFYSMDGVYPGATGHALIANDIIAFLNSTYHKTFSPVNIATVAAADPALQYLKPKGTLYTPSSLGIAGSQE